MARLLSVAEASVSLRISTRMVRKYCESGALKATRVGRDWVIDAAALARFERRPVGRPPKR